MKEERFPINLKARSSDFSQSPGKYSRKVNAFFFCLNEDSRINPTAQMRGESPGKQGNSHCKGSAGKEGIYF